jgi:hypothetical protein
MEPLKHDISGMKLIDVEPTPPISLQQTVTLTEKERAIFDFLIQVLKDNGR